MAYSKIKKILFILLCLFVLLFPFWCVRGLCAEPETIQYNTVQNLTISQDRNYFDTGSFSVGYFLIEKGYIYHIFNSSTIGSRSIAFSDDIPVLNGTYTYLGTIEPNSIYSIIGDSSNEYIYFDFSGVTSVTVTREKFENMDGVVNDLVNNVGIQSLWNTFNDANPFILVVVLFSFGFFIIVVLVRKLRKGKGGL